MLTNDHQWDERLLNGFAGVFDNEQLNALRASGEVASIAQDGIFTIQAVQYVIPTLNRSEPFADA